MKMFRGVIEDNNDPLKIGRVRVRIFGLHTPNNENTGAPFNFIDSKDLPWAEVIGGTEFGLISGIGLSNILKQGTWVWVVLDHDNVNKPIIIGVIKGYSKKRKTYKSGEGFNDKDDVYPLSARVEESDLNRIARGGDLSDPTYNSPHKHINDNIDNVSISDASSGANVSQTEPLSTSDLSTYPECSVLETASGHMIEIDDTPNNERLRLYHKSGSYIEIQPDGSIIQKSTGPASHYIHVGDIKKHVIAGVKEYIEMNKEEIIGGSLLSNVKGNVKLHVQGNLDWVVDGNITISTGNYKVAAARIDLN